ncbi:MAG: MFS transporter [Anaerolineae bacterium]
MNPNLIFLSLALFTWGIGEGMFWYFQPIYLEQLGANPVTIGTILGASGLAMMIAHIPAGHLSDRIGRRPLLIAAWSCGVVAAWMMALARSLPLFVAGLLLYGFTAFVASPLNSYVTAARGNWSVGRALTLISATFNLGAVLGPISGGWLGTRFGLRPVYAVAASLFVLSTLLVLLIRPQPRDGHDPESPHSSLFTNRAYWQFLAVVFVVMFVLYLPQPLTPNFLRNVRGLSLTQIGLLGTLGMLGNALLVMALGALFSARTGFLVAQALVGFFAVLIWKGTGMPVYGLAYFLLGGFRAARPLAAAQVRALVHPAQMGLAFGVNETLGALALMLAPVAAGFLYDRSPEMVYPISLVAIFAVLILSAIWAPRAGMEG